MRFRDKYNEKSSYKNKNKPWIIPSAVFLAIVKNVSVPAKNLLRTDVPPNQQFLQSEIPIYFIYVVQKLYSYEFISFQSTGYM